MKRRDDLTGQRFGWLKVLEMLDEVNKFGYAQFLCECGCGKRKIITGNSLRKGTSSCGCKAKKGQPVYLKHNKRQRELKKISSRISL